MRDDGGAALQQRRAPTKRWLIAACGVWLLAVGASLGLLTHHSLLPGAAAMAPPAWPAGSTLELARDRHTLVMVAHPQCTCTRASIAELAQLTSRLRERVATHVLFLKPAGTASDWTRTGLWAAAAALDGVTVIADEGGREAARFGALTSGQTYLFDAAGRLLFRGGITPGRAHQGDNVGRERITAVVEGHEVSRALSAVYGCALFEAPDSDFWFSWLRPRATASNR